MTPDLRIGDRERDAAVSALGEHYVAGRLTKEEYDERSSVAWQARTNADLTPLFSDLPPLRQSERPTSPVARTGAPRAGRGRPVAWRGTRLPLLPLILVMVGLAMLTDAAVVLVIFGVLWWTGALRWLLGAAPRRRMRC